MQGQPPRSAFAEPQPSHEDPAGPFRIVFTEPTTLWASAPAYSRRDPSVDLPFNTKVHVEKGVGGWLRDDDNQPHSVHAFLLSADAEVSKPLGWLDLSWVMDFYRFRPEDVEFSMFDLLRPDGSIVASGRAALWIMKNCGRSNAPASGPVLSGITPPQKSLSSRLNSLCAAWTAQEISRERLRLSGEFTFGDLEEMPISQIQGTWRRYSLAMVFQNCRDAYMEHARVIFDEDLRVIQLQWDEAAQLLTCTNMGGVELAELALGEPGQETRHGRELQTLLAEEQGVKPQNMFLILPDGAPIERAQLDRPLLELLEGQ